MKLWERGWSGHDIGSRWIDTYSERDKNIREDSASAREPHRRSGDINRESMGAPATGASVDELHEVSHGHDEEVLEVDSTVGVLTEGLLLRGGVLGKGREGRVSRERGEFSTKNR